MRLESEGLGVRGRTDEKGADEETEMKEEAKARAENCDGWKVRRKRKEKMEIEGKSKKWREECVGKQGEVALELWCFLLSPSWCIKGKK